MAKFDNDFVIQNFGIEQLSSQKKKSGDSGGPPKVHQVPFSLGVATSHRGGGLPYICSRGGNIEVIFPTQKTHSVVD